MKRWLIGSLSVLLTIQAGAQQPAQGAKATRKPRVIRLEEIRIEGRIQKPNAFYILNRSNIGYSITELKTTFIPHVVNSVRKHPF